MAFPKKGSRKIKINGITYHWTIRHKPTYTQPIGQENILVAVELYENPKSALSIRFPWVRYDSFFGVAKKPVTPEDIKQCIEQAIKDGWSPGENKSDFNIEYVGL